MRLDARRIALLESQLAAANGRLGRLAELRAAYANLVAEAASRSKLVERAEQNMAEARAARAAPPPPASSPASTTPTPASDRSVPAGRRSSWRAFSAACWQAAAWSC